LITLPFYIPPILTAMAWGMLATPKGGVINLAWTALTGIREPLVNIYSYGGVVWHMMQYSTPFLFLLLVSGLRAMDPTLEESSRTSGASQWTTFRRVTLGLMLPVTTSAFLLSFIRGVESFESALIFGTPAGIEVITTEIYHLIHHVNRPDYQQATALALGIMVLMFGLVGWQWRLLGGRSFVTVTGKGYTPRVTRLGRWRWVTLGVCLLFFAVTVVLPVGQLIIGSFFKSPPTWRNARACTGRPGGRPSGASCLPSRGRRSRWAGSSSSASSCASCRPQSCSTASATRCSRSS
jgi:iron(III) transport system permease protein